MSDLRSYFDGNSDRIIHKWLHYFDAYERHFSRFRHRHPVVMEVGVAHGGSLHMWRDYFGAGARIIGCDFSRKCVEMQEEGFEIFIGDQADPAFWTRVKDAVPRVDIFIDDGGHRMDQQRVTFDEMFHHVKDDGVYLCEDLQTSYRPRWGGGYRHPDSFIEYVKNLVDHVNGWHSTEPERFGVTALTRAIDSVHFYDSMVFVEKRYRTRPLVRRTGRRRLGGVIDAPENASRDTEQS